jgi:hypothetical protein
MALARLRWATCLLTAVLAFPYPSSAFDTPLSDTAVREAYFLGQHRDESLARFLDKYTIHLAAPKTGPYIASLTFLTPYAQAVQLSSSYPPGYSAQQAEIDHRKHEETVKLIIQIWLTESYGPFLSRPTGSRSDSPTGIALRPYDFWKDFDVQVFNNDKFLRPFSFSGEPTYRCDDGGCILTGATLEFEFLATVFSADSTAVQIDPPEGEQVVVGFDLATVR